METLSVVAAVIVVGLFFGLSKEIGQQLAEIIINKIKRPVTIKIEQSDGSIVDVVMTAKEYEAHKRFMKALKSNMGDD